MCFSVHWSFGTLSHGLQVLEREIECLFFSIMHSMCMVLMT